MVKKNRVSIRDLFGGLQAQMSRKMRAVRKSIPHPTTQGDVVEAGWISLLSEHLPARYQVRKAFVIDSWGRLSDQIDLVIFDRQYSPFLLTYNGACYVPAESVYAAMETKPRLNRTAMRYASKKISSVRRLLRTSAQIAHAGGVYEARRPFELLGGLITEDSDWADSFGPNFENAIQSAVPAERLNIGCVLSHGGFYIHYETSVIRIETTGRRDAIVFFLLKLLQSLQSLGTVPAMDIREYARSLPIREKALMITKVARSRPRQRR